jgi:hypothetical protein
MSISNSKAFAGVHSTPIEDENIEWNRHESYTVIYAGLHASNFFQL